MNDTGQNHGSHLKVREQRPSHFIECGTCGNEPNDQEERPRQACPKCHAYDWRRIWRPEVPPTGPHRHVQRPQEPNPFRASLVVRSENRVYLAVPPRRPQRGARKAVPL